MPAHRPRVSTVIALLSSTALLVVGMDTLTYASTGDSLLIGRVNSAGKPTVLDNQGRDRRSSWGTTRSTRRSRSPLARRSRS